MLKKDQLARDIQQKANELSDWMNKPNGDRDWFIIELVVGELSTMVRVYRDMPASRR